MLRNVHSFPFHSFPFRSFPVLSVPFLLLSVTFLSSPFPLFSSPLLWCNSSARMARGKPSEWDSSRSAPERCNSRGRTVQPLTVNPRAASPRRAAQCPFLSVPFLSFPLLPCPFRSFPTPFRYVPVLPLSSLFLSVALVQFICTYGNPPLPTDGLPLLQAVGFSGVYRKRCQAKPSQ